MASAVNRIVAVTLGEAVASGAAKQAAGASELIRFLTAPSAVPVIKKKGMEPTR